MECKDMLNLIAIIVIPITAVLLGQHLQNRAEKYGGAEMSMNISKQKREDLLAKIKEIRTFISAVP